MGAGIYIDPAVRHQVDVMKAAGYGEVPIIEALLFDGATVADPGLHVPIAVLAQPPSRALLTIGAWAFGVELLNQTQLDHLRGAGREVDERGPVTDVDEWHNEEASTWQVWNCRVRSFRHLQPDAADGD